MTNMKTYQIEMEIAGNSAMWTRPDSGDGFVSYPAPTYSAVKAIFESVLWGPAIEIVPTKVEICAPIKYHSYHTNYGGPLRRDRNIKNETMYQMRFTVLVDVCYRLYANININPNKMCLPQKALEWDRKTTSPAHAYQEIFNRRIMRGQCYSVPCLGIKEFTPSYFGVLRDTTTVYDEMPPIIIPSMLRHVFPYGYKSSLSFAYDHDVRIEKGVMVFPKGARIC